MEELKSEYTTSRREKKSRNKIQLSVNAFFLKILFPSSFMRAAMRIEFMIKKKQKL